MKRFQCWKTFAFLRFFFFFKMPVEDLFKLGTLTFQFSQRIAFRASIEIPHFCSTSSVKMTYLRIDKKKEAETHSALCGPNPSRSCWDFRLARLHLSGKFIQSYLPGLLVNQDQWQRFHDEKLCAGMPSEPTMIVLTEGH